MLHILAPAQHGGLERVVEMLAVGQRSSGVHVACVLSPDEAMDHPFVGRLQNLGVPVTPVVVTRRGYYREYKSLRALCTRLRPGIVHTHGYRADIVGGLAGRKLGIPTVSTVHGFVGGSLRNRVNEVIQCIALRRASAVIAVSSPLVEHLTATGISRRKIHFVRNGFAAGGANESRASGRRMLGIADNEKVVGWVGRLSPEKGPDVMLDALSHSDNAWQLSMIGDGPERQRLSARAAALGVAHRVRLHGALPNAGSLLSAFDAFVLSSRSEGTPIVLFEAMHAGVPIVATKVGGVPDVATQEDALLVPPENPLMLARALGDLERDPDGAVRRSRAASRKVRESFDVSSWTAKVDSVYRVARESRHHT